MAPKAKAAAKAQDAANEKKKPNRKKPRYAAPFAKESHACANFLIGREVRKEFKGFGVFNGVVSSFHRETGFRVEYEDGDHEDLSEASLVRATPRPRCCCLCRSLPSRPAVCMRAADQAARGQRPASRPRRPGRVDAGEAHNAAGGDGR